MSATYDLQALESNLWRLPPEGHAHTPTFVRVGCQVLKVKRELGNGKESPHPFMQFGSGVVRFEKPTETHHRHRCDLCFCFFFLWEAKENLETDAAS